MKTIERKSEKQNGYQFKAVMELEKVVYDSLVSGGQNLVPVDMTYVQVIVEKDGQVIGRGLNVKRFKVGNNWAAGKVGLIALSDATLAKIQSLVSELEALPEYTEPRKTTRVTRPAGLCPKCNTYCAGNCA
jgi:hypothetical protein